MENKAVDENSGNVSKHVHQFNFVKLWPTVPDSVSQIQREEKVIKTMNQDIWEITDKIAKRTLEKEYLDFNMALDELNFRNVKVENGGWFGEKLDKNSLNYLRLHGSKSLVEERKIMRDIKIQQKDVSPFKSLEVLKETLLCNGGSLFFNRRVKNLEQMIRENYYLSDRQKLVIEIEQFQIQHKERASKYDYLKKTIKEQIKLLCDDDSLKNRREWMEFGARNKHNVKEQVAINGELYSLKEKLTDKYKKREEAFQMLLKLNRRYLI
ncbi:uncharacterized protein LOC127086902 [Lathyrus oleraceus]|uniref:Uncharacterized protein n=1 Tax=Pisum sativum TaxID=3888 RepID=A0A9D5AID2_PEA|nr:uncharacterized protein LOC127086902 [Pisum sativum]KAI5412957.1 hypothetical protein KIW84_057541 [Pisum sativum]